jgi:hypothetical protein
VKDHDHTVMLDEEDNQNEGSVAEFEELNLIGTKESPKEGMTNGKV